MDIFISINDDSVDSSDTVNSPDSFVTEKPYPSFGRDNLLAEDFKINRITSKYSDTTNSSTAEELHNADIIRSQMDTGAKVSCNKLKYIIHNYRKYTSKFLWPIRLTVSIDTSKNTLP